ncbi:MAG TPA: radical SAM protein [Gemmataceae bacterium]|nr:radical SAM protein [Gemmataceae bacterium]
MIKKRVALINPKTVNKYYHLNLGGLDRLFAWFFKRFYDNQFEIPSHTYCTTMPPVTLYALEALFGGRCETRVIDEQVDQLDLDLDADLVCVTATTPQIPRAYAIARHFRARGISTAIGGVHATCLADECGKHFDTVCIGEAEGYIDELVQDLANGQMRPRYSSRTAVSLANIPFYRYEIGTGKYLPFHVINFSRGCVFKCDYCSIQSTLGSFRTRPVEQIVEEIEAVGSKNLWFPDATLTANPQKARELFKALAPLKVRWLGQITLNIAKDEAMLDLLAQSGCWLVGIGFDSLSRLNVRTARKVQNRVEDYARVIEELHKRKIAIEGNFVFGFDEDYADVFDATAQFVLEAGIDLPEFYVLTPYPDTELYRRLRQANRIVDFDWGHYDNTHFHHLPVFQPKHMSREELRAGCRAAERKVYRTAGTLRRLAKARVWHLPVLMANFIYSRRLRHRGDLVPEGEELRSWELQMSELQASP